MKNMDEPVREEKVTHGKFPRIIIVMLPVQLVQAFSQNVMLSIKAIFITSFLGYGEDSAVMISHIFISFEPISHLTGAILADSTFGKWKIIVMGMILMRIPDIFFIFSVLPNFPNRSMFLTAVTLATLLNIHLPTLSAFFSEQFRMPEQEKLLKRYYNLLYWGRNAVSVLGAISGSRLASKSCFGQSDCYFYPFVVWIGTEILVAVVIIALGRFFVKKPPTTSVTLHFLECVARALYNKARSGKEERRKRWIDHADDAFTEDFRDDVFILINMSYFFMLGILYWSLYDQMYTRFIYQGAKLNQYLTDSFRVYPGDTTILNPVLVIILLPLLEYVVYPVCKKIKLLTTDLQKVGCSEYLVATAFVAATILEWQIRKNEIHPPADGTGHLVVFNSLNQKIQLSGDAIGNFKVGPLSSHVFQSLSVGGSKNIDIRVRTDDGFLNKDYSLTIEEKKGISYVLTENRFDVIKGYEVYRKNQKMNNAPQIRCVCVSDDCYDLSVCTNRKLSSMELRCLPPGKAIGYKKINEGTFFITGSGIEETIKIRIEDHMDYTLLVLDDPYNPVVLFQSNPHYLVPYYWIIPQIFIMTLGEIMHAIPWRLFIYTQSPPAMRSVVFALDLLARSLGDLVVAVVAATSFLEQLYEFMLYASLMYVVSILFTILAVRYKPHESRD